MKAVVALDNLGGPGPDGGAVPGSPNKGGIGEAPCPADPADRTSVPITKPGLGISADYGLPPLPNLSLPDPRFKEAESLAYSKARVDSGEIVIRGGSHLDFSFIPNPAFGASYYGPDITDWYTTAWFDKYLKHSPEGDAMLLSQRWRDYAPEATIDPNHDGNAFSFYYDSRLDFHLDDGSVRDCEDLRDGCPGMVPSSGDGYNGNYSYVAIDTTPDAVTGVAAPLRHGNSLTACAARDATTIRIARVRGRTVTRAVVFIDGRRVMTRRGKPVRAPRVPGLAGSKRHTITVDEYAGKRLVRHHAPRVRLRAPMTDVTRRELVALAEPAPPHSRSARSSPSPATRAAATPAKRVIPLPPLARSAPTFSGWSTSARA